MNLTLFNSIDFLVVPLAIIFIMIIMSSIRRNQPEEIKKYFFLAFYLRILGTFSISAIYQYVYGYGDTFFYYYHTQVISSFFSKNITAWWQILINDPAGENQFVLACMEKIGEIGYVNTLFFSVSENANISKIGAIFNLVCFDSYLGISLFFSFFSFLGCWGIFRTFIKLYPGFNKEFAILCLFLPSLWFWGNGILKDPLSLYGVGILVYNVYASPKHFIKRIILVVIGALILTNTKSYILGAFAIAAILAFVINKIRNFNFIKRSASFLMIIGVFAVLYSSIANFVFEAFTDIIATSQAFLTSYDSVSNEGTGFVVATFDPTPFGFFVLSLEGLVNVFLRPFPWEIRKFVYLFSILENLLLYFILFKKIKPTDYEFPNTSVLFKTFCFIFFILLGIIIGVTTFNLGTISRYRVPALPFLFAGIFAYKVIKANKKVTQNLSN